MVTLAGCGGKTLGPNILFGKDAGGRSAESRTSSASSRRRGPRQSRLFSGSFSSPATGDGARLLVGLAGDDEAVEFLERPAVIHEADGQPVEELRMGRRAALESEVLLGLDDAATKEGGPGAIDDDACGEGIFAADEPACEAEAVFGSAVRQRIENG